MRATHRPDSFKWGCAARSWSSTSRIVTSVGSPALILPAPPRPVECAPGPRERERDCERESVRRMFPAPPRPVVCWDGQQGIRWRRVGGWGGKTHDAEIVSLVDLADALALVFLARRAAVAAPR
jgi:hypothetical protein